MTQFVCGYFGCERHADRLFLAGPAADDQDQPAGRPGRRMAGELGSSSCLAGWIRATGTVGPALQDGGGALHRNHSPLYGGAAAEQTGWLAGARDPVVGGALALLHRKPCHHWTVEQLAAETGVSRSVLAEQVLAVSRRAAADLSCALATATRCQDAANHAGRR